MNTTVKGIGIALGENPSQRRVLQVAAELMRINNDEVVRHKIFMLQYYMDIYN